MGDGASSCSGRMCDPDPLSRACVFSSCLPPKPYQRPFSASTASSARGRQVFSSLHGLTLRMDDMTRYAYGRANLGSGSLGCEDVNFGVEMRWKKRIVLASRFWHFPSCSVNEILYLTSQIAGHCLCYLQLYSASRLRCSGVRASSTA